MSETYEWYDRAEARVNKTRKLWRYSEHLLREWENGADDHYQWVATAPLKELLTWCSDFDRG